MILNVGEFDRWVRFSGALALVALIGFGTITGGGALLAGIAAAGLAITGAVRVCPAYRLFGIDTGAPSTTAHSIH